MEPWDDVQLWWQKKKKMEEKNLLWSEKKAIVSKPHTWWIYTVISDFSSLFSIDFQPEVSYEGI